jgi:Plant organelle RNA recognition domain
LRQLEKYRNRINLPKPYKVADFIRKYPKLFVIYKDTRGISWCGLTAEAEELLLLEEEVELLERNNEKTMEYVTRLLMDKIAQFRPDMGLPINFRTEWVTCSQSILNLYVQGIQISWSLSVTKLEKKIHDYQ